MLLAREWISRRFVNRNYFEDRRASVVVTVGFMVIQSYRLTSCSLQCVYTRDICKYISKGCRKWMTKLRIKQQIRYSILRRRLVNDPERESSPQIGISEIPKQIYGLWSNYCKYYFEEVRHLSGRLKITPGECILRVTSLNGECYKSFQHCIAQYFSWLRDIYSRATLKRLTFMLHY